LSKLEVWSVTGTDPCFYMDEELLDKLAEQGVNAWPGRSLKDYWGHPTVYLDTDYPGRKPTSFIMESVGKVAMSLDVRAIFEPVFGRFGEFLPTRIEGLSEPYFVFNALNRKPALDWSTSTRATPRSEAHLDFIPSQLVHGEVFLDDEVPHLLLTVEGGDPPGLLSFCRKHGFTGLGFRKEFPGGRGKLVTP
jgi:hypothetical protein